MNYQVIKVGDKVIEPCSDGIRFGITDGGAVLVIHYSGLTEEEKKAFKDRVSINFSAVNGMIFILARMGKLNWDDCPYYRYYFETEPNLPEIPDGKGLLVQVMLVEASDGTLVAQKILGCKTDGSKKFVQAIKEQKKYDPVEYEETLRRTMQLYSTSRLVQQSISLF